MTCSLPNMGETVLSRGVWLPKSPRFYAMRLFFLLLRMSVAICSPLLIWSSALNLRRPADSGTMTSSSLTLTLVRVYSPL